MEAHRSIAGKLQRKPLGDCTNTISRTTQQSSSSSVKFANPSLTSSLKRLVDQTSIKEKLDDVIQSKAGSGIASESLSTTVRPVTRRMSSDLGFPAPTPSRPSKPKQIDKPEADSGSGSRSVATRVRPITRRMSTDLGFPASAPPRPQNSRSGEGVGDKEVADPYSVYTVRRKASGRKNNKDPSSSSAVTRLRLDLISSPGKKRHKPDQNKPKPSKVAPKKRQRTAKHEEDNLAHGIPHDYIEKQRAYFAEVDAFELPEEEVSSSDLD